MIDISVVLCPALLLVAPVVVPPGHFAAPGPLRRAPGVAFGGSHGLLLLPLVLLGDKRSRANTGGGGKISIFGQFLQFLLFNSGKSANRPDPPKTQPCVHPCKRFGKL